MTSLVDGVAGICEVQMGNLVGPISHLTSVSQVDPIKVYFPVSEQEYLRAKHISSSGQPMDLFDSSPELILSCLLYTSSGRIAGNGGAAERLGLKRTTLQNLSLIHI